MKSFSWTTGWVATVVTILLTLTAADMVPFVKGFLASILGEETASAILVPVIALGTLIAKLSHSSKPETPSE